MAIRKQNGKPCFFHLLKIGMCQNRKIMMATPLSAYVFLKTIKCNFCAEAAWKFTEPLMHRISISINATKLYVERLSNKNWIAELKILIDRRRRGVINKYNLCVRLMYTQCLLMELSRLECEISQLPILF